MNDYLCRLCLGADLPLSNIFASEGDIKIIDIVQNCLGIMVHPGDCMPAMICEQCKNDLKKYFAFKQRCLKVDINLKALYQPDNEQILVTNQSNQNELQHESCYKTQHEVRVEKVQNTISETCMSSDCKESTSIFQCEQCGQKYKAKKKLERHLMGHLGIKLFPCKLCFKKYTRYEHLKVHIRSHTGFKPYICEICGSSSTKQQDLSRHMKIHSEERNFACPLCARRFKRSSDIASHMRTHTGARPYNCSVCGKSYVSHSGLRKHLLSNCKTP